MNAKSFVFMACKQTILMQDNVMYYIVCVITTGDFTRGYRPS